MWEYDPPNNGYLKIKKKKNPTTKRNRKDIFKTIEYEQIMQQFQNMKNCYGQLSKLS